MLFETPRLELDSSFSIGLARCHVTTSIFTSPDSTTLWALGCHCASVPCRDLFAKVALMSPPRTHGFVPFYLHSQPRVYGILDTTKLGTRAPTVPSEPQQPNTRTRLRPWTRASREMSHQQPPMTLTLSPASRPLLISLTPANGSHTWMQTLSLDVRHQEHGSRLLPKLRMIANKFSFASETIFQI